MAVRLRIEPYDPDARDADGDGIVQEQTAWERPAGTRLISDIGEEIARGLTSESRPSFRIVDREGRVVPYTPRYGGTGAPGEAGGQPRLEAPRFRSLSDMGYKSIGDIVYPAPSADKPGKSAPSAPKPTRKKTLIQASVNPEQYNERLAARVDSMLERRLPPERRNAPPREIIDDLVADLGVTMPKPFEQQLDDAMVYMDTYIRQNMDSFTRLAESDDEFQAARAKIMLEQVTNALQLLDTEEGREILKNKMAEKFIYVLEGYDDVLGKNPGLGNQVISLYSTTDPKARAGGYAFVSIDDDGMLFGRININPQSLVLDSFNVEGQSSGQFWDTTVRLLGTDDYQVGLAVHELGHQVHFASTLKRHGIEMSKEKSVIEQLKSSGDSLDSHYLSLGFAAAQGLSPSTKYDDLSDGQRRDLSLFIANRTHDITDSFIGKPEGYADSPEMRRGLMFAGTNSYLTAAIDSYTRGVPLSTDRYIVPEELSTPEKIAAFFRETSGMELDELMRELADAREADYGMNPRHMAFNGLSRDEAEALLIGTSEYAASSPYEAVAEAFTLLNVLSNVPDSTIPPEDLARISATVSQITDGLNMPTKGIKVSDRYLAAYNALIKAVQSPIFKSLDLNVENLA